MNHLVEIQLPSRILRICWLLFPKPRAVIISLLRKGARIDLGILIAFAATDARDLAGPPYTHVTPKKAVTMTNTHITRFFDIVSNFDETDLKKYFMESRKRTFSPKNQFLFCVLWMLKIGYSWQFESWMKLRRRKAFLQKSKNKWLRTCKSRYEIKKYDWLIATNMWQSKDLWQNRRPTNKSNESNWIHTCDI